MEQKDIDELNKLAKEYCEAKEKSDQLAKQINKLRNDIISKLGANSVFNTEGYHFELVDGCRSTLNKDPVIKKLKELNIEIDQSWWKVTNYVTLKVTTLEDVATPPDDNDPNRIKVSLDDLKI